MSVRWVDRVTAKIDSTMRRHWANYRRTLEAQVDGHGFASLLDVGCGERTPLADVLPRIPYSVGVDAYLPAIEASRSAGLHTEYVHANVLALDEIFPPGSFDVVVAAEVIEHLSKADGLRLLASMARIARKRVVVVTPNGWLPQEPIDGNEYQRHLSGWEVAEMRALGYRVIGANGWRPLRGDRAHIRWRPEWLWEKVSFLTQDWVARSPRHAFHICCVKDLEEEGVRRSSRVA